MQREKTFGFTSKRTMMRERRAWNSIKYQTGNFQSDRTSRAEI
jgi:hypothetical protein